LKNSIKTGSIKRKKLLLLGAINVLLKTVFGGAKKFEKH
jgi:hypothetical protein